MLQSENRLTFTGYRFEDCVKCLLFLLSAPMTSMFEMFWCSLKVELSFGNLKVEVLFGSFLKNMYCIYSTREDIVAIL